MEPYEKGDPVIHVFVNADYDKLIKKYEDEMREVLERNLFDLYDDLGESRPLTRLEQFHNWIDDWRERIALWICPWIG